MKTIDFLGKDYFLVIKRLLDGKKYLRELSEETLLAPSSIHNITQKLVKNKILSKTNEKNRTFFSLNFSSPETREIIKLFFIHNLICSKGFHKLKKLSPKKILLFGSVSKGIVDKNSDVDLAIIFNKTPSTIEISTIKILLSKEIDREVQIITLNEKDFSSKNEKSETIKSIQNSIELWNAQKN